MTPFTIAILAGGKSSRMGQNKALLDMGGKALLQIMLERLKSLEAEIFLIANDSETYQQFKLPIIPDKISDKAALGGIYTALLHSKTEACFVLACDMPLIEAKLLRHMADSITEDALALVPRFHQHPQALHSLYKKSCLKPLETALSQNQLKIRQFFDSINIQYFEDYKTIDPNGLSFTNLNTPQDLQLYQKLMNT
jgi:molybdopterin-guanine dinucleotide biosynthesis protein A